jgi:hypothetical protein
MCCMSKRLGGKEGLIPSSQLSVTGTVLDLPYNYPANKKKMQIERNFPFDPTDVERKRDFKNQKHAEQALAQQGGDDRTVSTSGTKKSKKFKPKPSIREMPIEPVAPRPPRRSVPPPPPPPKQQCCTIL